MQLHRKLKKSKGPTWVGREPLRRVEGVVAVIAYIHTRSSRMGGGPNRRTHVCGYISVNLLI